MILGVGWKDVVEELSSDWGGREGGEGKERDEAYDTDGEEEIVEELGAERSWGWSYSTIACFE